MGHGKKPGTECHSHGVRRVKDGTLCQQPSATPGPSGLGPSVWSGLSGAWETAGGWIDSAEEAAGRAGKYMSGHSRSLLLTLLDTLGLKEDSPMSTAFLKHYVEGSGDPYVIDAVPAEWQDWIVKATHARPGAYRDLNPYNSGLFDLRNSLGHFRVDVIRLAAGRNRYTISDVYEFGYKKKDKGQTGRHGFPIGNRTDTELQIARSLLPTSTYKNPGGFNEKWEIKRVGQETILFIPQQFLDEQGKKFDVTGAFDK
jgi:hypothetical protein